MRNAIKVFLKAVLVWMMEEPLVRGKGNDKTNWFLHLTLLVN